MPLTKTGEGSETERHFEGLSRVPIVEVNCRSHHRRSIEVQSWRLVEGVNIPEFFRDTCRVTCLTSGRIW
jgi:hypothetical protein